MRRILLACAAGMSTSMLVLSMREAAKQQAYPCEIRACPISDVRERAVEADIVLLGPQVRFQASKIADMVPCPVRSIDPTAYGMMDGAAVVTWVRGVMND